MTTNSGSKEQIAETARIEQAITEVFGERCEAFDPDCMSCQAWAEVQAIKDLSLRTSSGGVTSGEVVTDEMVNRAFLAANDAANGDPYLLASQSMIRAALTAALSSLHAQPEGKVCQTCFGTGNEALHSICRDCDETQGTRSREAVAWCPDVCPLTQRPFFMWIDGEPTYGGPFDSYTIPTRDAEVEYSCRRYDHDEGGWKDWDEGLSIKVVDESDWLDLEDRAETAERERDTWKGTADAVGRYSAVERTRAETAEASLAAAREETERLKGSVRERADVGIRLVKKVKLAEAVSTAAAAFIPAYEEWMDKHKDEVALSFYRPATFGDLRAYYAALAGSNPK